MKGLVAFFTLALAVPAVAQNPDFARLLNAQTLEAEQILSSKMPKGSDPIHLFGFLKPVSMTGALPEQYTPLAQQTFEIPTVLIPADQTDVFEVEGAREAWAESVLNVELRGRKYVRLFIHPLEKERWAKLPYSTPDPEKWIATPCSSSRSLLVTNAAKTLRPFVAKTSLNFTLAGVFRTISREQARRAVQASAFYGDMMKETGGKIPHTTKTWTFFSESAALGVKGDDRQLTILRGIPADADRVTYLPLYALVADKGGDRWLDELFRASGARDRLEFVWNEIAKPLIEFHAMIHVDNGMVTELHQQNAMLRVDAATGRVLGLAVRDMDGHSIDYSARKHLLGKSLPAGGLSPETSDVFGYLYAREMPMLGFEYFKDAIFKNTMKYFLAPADVEKLVGRANALILERINARYAGVVGTIPTFENIKPALQKFYETVQSPEERKFFVDAASAERRSMSLFARATNHLIFKYYLLKQRFERNNDNQPAPTERARDGATTEQLLARIETEARGLVPEEPLRFWMHQQRFGADDVTTETPLDPSTEKTITKILATESDPALRAEAEDLLRTRKVSVLRLRALVLGHLGGVEDGLRKTGATKKAKLDFIDELHVLRQLNERTNPLWYSDSYFNINDFLGLMAMPLNIVGISRQVMHADGFELPPVEFAYHDELHALGMIPAQTEELALRNVARGSPAFYELVLERLRFSKDFVAYANGLPDPVERQILKTLWFDAFHDYFPVRSPYYRNYYVSPENLLKYVATHVTEQGKMRLTEKVRAMIGRSTFNRFVPGDFLPPSAKDQEQYSKERILAGFRRLQSFGESRAIRSCRQIFR